MALIGPEIELPAVLIALIPAAIISLSLYAWRLNRRRSRMSRAQNWPATDAIVNDSYELDENSGVVSRNLLTGSDENEEYVALWSTAIRYTYYVDGIIYPGTYFLPTTSEDGHIAAEAGRGWIGRRIAVRYNPHRPHESVFLEQDGAPGKPYVSRLVSDQPELITLSLR